MCNSKPTNLIVLNQHIICIYSTENGEAIKSQLNRTNTILHYNNKNIKTSTITTIVSSDTKSRLRTLLLFLFMSPPPFEPFDRVTFLAEK
jgi:hypothetical protein